MIRTGVLLLTLLAASPALAQDADAPLFDGGQVDVCLEEALANDRDPAGCIGFASENCMASPGGSTTVGMSYCLREELAHWDGLLNSAYGEAMTRAKAEDAELQQLGSAAEAQAPLLQDMQRKWIAFRDAACAHERSRWGGGTGGGPASAQCAMTLTAQQYLRLAAILREGG